MGWVSRRVGRVPGGIPWRCTLTAGSIFGATITAFGALPCAQEGGHLLRCAVKATGSSGQQAGRLPRSPQRSEPGCVRRRSMDSFRIRRITVLHPPCHLVAHHVRPSGGLPGQPGSRPSCASRRSRRNSTKLSEPVESVTRRREPRSEDLAEPTNPPTPAGTVTWRTGSYFAPAVSATSHNEGCGRTHCDRAPW